jgi:hypothetical protein
VDELLIGADEERGASPMQPVARNEHLAEGQIEQVSDVHPVRRPLGRNQIARKGHLEEKLDGQGMGGIGREFGEGWATSLVPSPQYRPVQVLGDIEQGYGHPQALEAFVVAVHDAGGNRLCVVQGTDDLSIDTECAERLSLVS